MWIDIVSEESDDFFGRFNQWWTNPALDYYFAFGVFGQWIFIVPKQDLVVVFTSTILEHFTHPHQSFLENFILASIQDTSSVSQFNPLLPTFLIAIVVPFFIAASFWVYRIIMHSKELDDFEKLNDLGLKIFLGSNNWAVYLFPAQKEAILAGW